MCGFTGFYTTQNQSRTTLHMIGQKMVRTLLHRGPDAGDLWQDPDHMLLLAHRRLSILDLSPEGAQPMVSASGRYVIVFNGEFYNYQILQKELLTLGVTFRGRSDTEVFLAGIETFGLNRTLQKINGMFAFVLWDRREQELHVVRDRLGKKPLYIGWAGKTLVFGSELKALRAHPDFEPALNPEALSHYIMQGWIHAPACIYQHVWALKPAHRITLSFKTLAPRQDLQPLMEPYWQPLAVLAQSRQQSVTLSQSELVDDFESLLTTCVSDRMISDVPLGAFLSGGIDSSTIVALMQTLSGRPVKTYTIGFHQSGFDEAQHARRIANHLGTDHHDLYLESPDVLDVIPRLPEMYDEPFADISAIPTYLVSRFAKHSVTVALSGDGGDEMLGGYNRHIKGPALWKRMCLTPHILRHSLSGVLKRIPANRLDQLRPHQPQFGEKLHKIASILTAQTQEELYLRLLSGWGQNPLLHPVDLRSALTPALPKDLSFSERIMVWDTLSYLPDDILTKIDRASMAVSLETRAPLLDPRIFEYVWRLPLDTKIRNAEGKWLLRQVLARHVPRPLFERPKQGFSMPVAEWLKGPLKDWAEDLLDAQDLKEQNYFCGNTVRAVWKAHLDGQGNHAQALWTVLMFQAWQKKWL